MIPEEMMTEEQVQRALRVLAEQDRELEARTEVETQVLQGFRAARRQRMMRMMRRAAIWPAAIAAAVAIAMVAPTRPKPADPPRRVEQPAAAPVDRHGDVLAAEPVPPTRTPAAAMRREVVTQFFALTDSSLPLDRGQLLRVRVPASMMYSVGLPVNPDRWAERVDADVLVGEEGMARAIRFVGYEQ